MKALYLVLSLFGLQALAAEYIPNCRAAIYDFGGTHDYKYTVTQDDLSGYPLPNKLGYRGNREEVANRYLVMAVNPAELRPGLNFASTISSSKDEQGMVTMQVKFERHDYTNTIDLHVRLQRLAGQKVWTAIFTEVDSMKHVVLNKLLDMQITETNGVLGIQYAGSLNVSMSCRVP